MNFIVGRIKKYSTEEVSSCLTLILIGSILAVYNDYRKLLAIRILLHDGWSVDRLKDLYEACGG